MSDVLTLGNAFLAILLIVGLVIYFKVNPLIALVAGPLYLGLSSGLSFKVTMEAITGGFGKLMGDIGLLIGFGVLIGAFLHKMGVFQRVVTIIANRFSEKQAPYALMVSLTTVFPAIYTDVLLLMSVPLARMMAKIKGNGSIPVMAAAVSVGIYLALTLVVPGVGALALSAVLGVDLGTMLLLGLAVAIPTGFITLFLYSQLIKVGLWNPRVDEQDILGDETRAVSDVVADRTFPVPLTLALMPVAVPIIMIASGAMNRAFDLKSAVLAAVGNSTFALFVGMLIAVAIAKWKLSKADSADAFAKAFAESGQILLLTGVAGSLSAVVALTDLGGILKGYFSGDAAAPLLLVWGVAAILHIAIGSVSASAITAAALLAPVANTLNVSPVYIALAAGSGALFLVHVTSNSFWLMGTLMGLTVRGTLKTLSLAVSIASVVSLPIIWLLAKVL